MADETPQPQPSTSPSQPEPKPAAKTSSGLAIAGLVLGILAILGSFLPIINNLSFILAVIGGILAIIAFVGYKRGKHTAKGISIAGIVLAVISVVVVLATQSFYGKVVDEASKELSTGPTPVASSTSSDTPQSDEKKDDKGEKKSEQADYSNMKVGETVTLGNGLSITVNSVQPGEAKYDGSPTVRANITYTNSGDSNEPFNIFDWKSVDANGVETSTTYMSQDKDQLDSGKLQPGGTVTGNVYFEGEPTKILYYSSFLQSESQIAWNIG